MSHCPSLLLLPRPEALATAGVSSGVRLPAGFLARMALSTPLRKGPVILCRKTCINLLPSRCKVFVGCSWRRALSCLCEIPGLFRTDVARNIAICRLPDYDAPEGLDGPLRSSNAVFHGSSVAGGSAECTERVSMRSHLDGEPDLSGSFARHAV